MRKVTFFGTVGIIFTLILSYMCIVEDYVDRKLGARIKKKKKSCYHIVPTVVICDSLTHHGNTVHPTLVLKKMMLVLH